MEDSADPDIRKIYILTVFYWLCFAEKIEQTQQNKQELAKTEKWMTVNDVIELLEKWNTEALETSLSWRSESKQRGGKELLTWFK